MLIARKVSLTGQPKPTVNQAQRLNRLSIYTAFATGKYTPDSSIKDSPVSFNDGGLERYKLQNYDRTFRGSMSIRTALAQSRNVPAIVLGQKVGIKNVIDVSRKLGITSLIPNVISLPLGAVDLTPIEMAVVTPKIWTVSRESKLKSWRNWDHGKKAKKL